MVAGFVVLCWANIVGNIISAEKRCNYPGRSRVTQLVSYMIDRSVKNMRAHLLLLQEARYQLPGW